MSFESLDPRDEARRKLDYIDSRLALGLADSGLRWVRADVLRHYPELDRPEPKPPEPVKPEPVPANGGYDPFAALFTGN